MSVVLVYGGKGWLGAMMCRYLAEANSSAIIIRGTARCNDYEAVLAETERVGPSHVACFTGRVRMAGKNNIDCLEDAFEVNFRDNFQGPAVLARVCAKLSIHFTYLGTGCIYTWQERPYTEEDPPNFSGSAYSRMKRATEEAVLAYPGALIFRIRLPQGADCGDPRSLLGKLGGFSHVTTTPNSMTIMPEVGPAMAAMIHKGCTGLYNAVNGTPLSNVDILNCYRDLVRRTGLNADVKPAAKPMAEDVEATLSWKRSNCVLGNGKMQAALEAIGHKPLCGADEALHDLVVGYCHGELEKTVDPMAPSPMSDVFAGKRIPVMVTRPLALQTEGEPTAYVSEHKGDFLVLYRDVEEEDGQKETKWVVRDPTGGSSIVDGSELRIKKRTMTAEGWAAFAT